MRHLGVSLQAGLALLALAAPAAAQVDPTADEMAFIWTLNRARNNPQRYASENGLGTLLDGIYPSPALAWNGNLNQSSRIKGQEMADNNYFAHQSTVGPTFYWPNELARLNGYPLNSGLADDSNQIESLVAGFPMTSLGALRFLIEDAGVEPPGHRYHLLATGPSAAFWLQHREAAVGYGFNAGSTYRNYYAVHTGYRDTGAPWLTGVVYNDANSNNLYDAGEGLAGVTVSALGGTSPSTVTNAQGGWSIQAETGTFYNVSCSGGAFSGTGTVNLTTGSQNIQVDFKSGVAAGDLDFGATPGVVLPPTDGSRKSKSGGCASGGGLDALWPLAAALLALVARRALGR